MHNDGVSHATCLCHSHAEFNGFRNSSIGAEPTQLWPQRALGGRLFWQAADRDQAADERSPSLCVSLAQLQPVPAAPSSAPPPSLMSRAGGFAVAALR